MTCRASHTSTRCLLSLRCCAAHSTSAVEPAAATTAPVEHPQKIRPPTCQPASRLSGHEGKLPGETPHSAAQQITQHPPDSISTGSPEQRQAVCRPDSGASQDTSAMLLLKQSLQSPQQTANLLLQHAKLLQQAKLIQQPHMACLANSTPPLQINSSSVAQRLPSSISNTGGGKQPGGAAASQAPSKAAAHDAGQQHNSPAAPHRAPDPAAEHRTAPATACTAALQSMLSQSPISGPCAVLAVPAVEAPALSDAAGTLSASAQQASASQPAATSPECRSLSSSPHSNHAAAIPVNAEQRQQSTDAAAPHHEHSVNISVAAGLTQPAAATAAPPALRQSPAASQPPASGSQAAVMAQSPAQPTAPESTAQLPTQFHDQSDQAEPAQPTAASGQAATDVLPGRVKRLPGGDPLEVLIVHALASACCPNLRRSSEKF